MLVESATCKCAGNIAWGNVDSRADMSNPGKVDPLKLSHQKKTKTKKKLLIIMDDTHRTVLCIQ